MKKTILKLVLSFGAFLAADLWLIAKAAAKGAADFFISPVVEETIVFILLQLAVTAIYFVRPLRDKKSRLIYWCVSEVFVFLTFFFWGIFIVGPIWLQ
ncbi:hypothetical protein [Ruminococcus sp.]|uniref:hypothetical protein n=1 Tax=Ruminococcus sp. TaxID=41978 RepID=UPI0025CE8C9E|nr:hypothetical protein [Ruminococcus sp.]MBQ8965975.1 hypothetical protein [Ruminococcus sp.]